MINKIFSQALNSTAINLLKKNTHGLSSVHRSNLQKWGIKGLVETRLFSKIKPEPKVLNSSLVNVKAGDMIEIDGKVKCVVGFNGSVSRDSVDTASGELFYGNIHVANKYAKRRAQEGPAYVRLIVSDIPPKDEDHNEAWFEGNWQPLKPAAIKDNKVEAHPIFEYELQNSKDIRPDTLDIFN
jgi:hypothetical protein